MCGITGICDKNQLNDISFDQIDLMLSSLHHRGPDESGVYIDDWVFLGHKRLSIIDLLGGTQPIHNENESLWIVYNGEIFNYPELKENLLKGGHHFYTSTDTEVLLHLYEDMGPSFLNVLNGQFAFAIWDSNQKELFLARDRLGIRPLYYTIIKDRIIFASEIKSIFMIKDVPREIDPIAMDQIFTFWTTLSERTIFKDIKELPPGHYLKFFSGSTDIRKYWQIPFCPQEEYLDLPIEQMSEKVLDILIDAVRIRLRADVQVGCYLSGGLDSSAITTLVKNNFNNELKTFGIYFEEEEFNEEEFQNDMASFLKTDHISIKVTNQEIGKMFQKVIWHCEKPLLRTAPVPLYILSDIVNRNGFKVVLTGEGADEVFGGYNIFKETKARRFWAKQPDSKYRPLLIGKLYRYTLNDPKLKFLLHTFFGNGIDNPDHPFFSHLIRWNNTSKIKKFFSEDLKTAINQYNSYEELKGLLPESFGGWDYLLKAQYLEMIIFLSNYLLSSQGDRVAMAHSMEIRLPYLDYRIIDFMGRIPAKWKIRGLKEKYILRKAFNNILPERIVKRSKYPYRAPIIQSLFYQNTPLIMETLSDYSLNKTNLFNISKVQMLLKKFQKTQRASELDNMTFAGILSSQLLYDQFINNFSFNSFKLNSIDLLINRRSGECKSSELIVKQSVTV